MRGLLLWISIVAAVASGSMVAAVLPERVVRAVVVAGWGAGLVLIGLGVLPRVWARRRATARASGGSASGRASGRGAVAWVVAAVLLGVVRGAVGGGPSTPWRETSRGPAAGVRLLEVREASQPGRRCRLRVAAVGPRGPGPPILLSVPRRVCPLAAGDRIAVPAATLRPSRAVALPGGSDRSRWVLGAGAVASAWTDAVWPVQRGRGPVSDASRRMAELRDGAWSASRGDAAASFVVASSLGLRQALPRSDREALRAAGLGHVIAVSGLHVGIAAWLVGRLLLRLGTALGGTTWVGVVASWAFVAGYVLLTGSPASAVRAGLMAAAAGLGDALGRPAHGLVLLAAASAVMVVLRPAWLLDPGFQLSVVAMAVLVRTPADAGLVRSTWRVTWGVVPVALLHFDRVGAWAVVSNLVAVPIVTLWTLPLGLLGSLLVPWLGADALVPAAWGARAVLDVAQVVASWPAVPPELLAGVASVSLLVTSSLRFVRRQGRPLVAMVRRWAVPPMAAVAVVLVVAWPSRGSPAPTLAWAAVGSPQRHAVVVAEDPGVACMRGSSLAAHRWPGLLEALGVERIDALEPERRASPQAPHRRALVAALRDAGLLSDDPGRVCPGPARQHVRDRLRHCRRLAGPGAAVVRVDPQGHAMCWVRGAFVPFAVD